MQEVLTAFIGIIIGTSATLLGCWLGAYLVKRTYTEVTNPYPIVVKEAQKDEEDLRSVDAYDWDSYDAYIKGIEDDTEEVPEA